MVSTLHSWGTRRSSAVRHRRTTFVPLTVTPPRPQPSRVGR